MERTTAGTFTMNFRSVKLTPSFHLVAELSSSSMETARQIHYLVTKVFGIFAAMAARHGKKRSDIIDDLTPKLRCPD